jgi:hypothetical protein
MKSWTLFGQERPALQVSWLSHPEKSHIGADRGHKNWILASPLVSPLPQPHDATANSILGSLAGNSFDHLNRFQRGIRCNPGTESRQAERQGGALDVLSAGIADQHESQTHWDGRTPPRFLPDLSRSETVD